MDGVPTLNKKIITKNTIISSPTYNIHVKKNDDIFIYDDDNIIEKENTFSSRPKTNRSRIKVDEDDYVPMPSSVRKKIVSSPSPLRTRKNYNTIPESPQHFAISPKNNLTSTKVNIKYETKTNVQEIIMNGKSRPDYDNLPIMQQREFRSDFASKFRVLSSNFSEWEIPVFDPDTSLHTIHDLYESRVKTVVCQQNCAEWKQGLAIYFLGLESVGKFVFGIDTTGYANAQFLAIEKYDKMLVEMGERPYLEGFSKWPVEARIVIASIVQMIIFIVSKLLCDKLHFSEEQRNNMSSFISERLANFGSTTQELDNLGMPKVNATSGGGIADMFGSFLGGDVGATIAKAGSSLLSSFDKNKQPDVKQKDKSKIKF